MNNIEALKKNEKPFGLMSEEMQAKARELGDCIWQHYRNGEWQDISSMLYYSGLTYRLRPDYTEEPEIEKCEVLPEGGTGDLIYKRNPKDNPSIIAAAPADPDFIGYLYEDDPFAYPDARRYKDKEGRFFGFWKPGFEVLTPTHVGFRKDK